MFKGSIQGKGKGKSYKWLGSTQEDMPYVTFFNKHPTWKTKNKKLLIDTTIRVLNHEPIHQILWKLKEDDNTDYDISRFRFLKTVPKKLKKELKMIM